MSLYNMKITLINADGREDFENQLKIIEKETNVKFGETKVIELSPEAQKTFNELKEKLFNEKERT